MTSTNLTADAFRDSVVAAFEAAMLVRCTAGRAAGRDDLPWAEATTEAVVEFSQAPAAQRMAYLLREAGTRVREDTYVAGNRHRYVVHRVVTPAAASERLDDAWRSGYRELCGKAGGYLSHRQRWHCARLAAAAWRAALLAAGRAKLPLLGVRVADMDTAAVLVRASRFLNVPVALLNRPGGPLLTMPDGEAVQRLEQAAGIDEVLSTQAA